ncbi:hypothetical protein [Methylocella sp.]|uniref:hypothetical protein n=1 Tax=Methylocella sp. TaxID=1978226 RepID=UPI0035B2E598
MTGRIQDGASAGDWRALFTSRRWEALEGLWRHLPVGDQRDLLDALRRDVPKVVVEDGVERVERHALPRELGDGEKEWQGAAKIVALGELEAAVEGDPPPANARWDDLRAEADALLHARIDAETPFAARPRRRKLKELSEEWHAEKAVGALERFNLLVAWAGREMDSDDDRDWLAETIAAVAVEVFTAGRHMQAALGKPVEFDAVRGRKSLAAASEGGKARARMMKHRTSETVAEMRRLIAEGRSKGQAARIAFNRGFGPSFDANKKLLARQK